MQGLHLVQLLRGTEGKVHLWLNFSGHYDFIVYCAISFYWVVSRTFFERLNILGSVRLLRQPPTGMPQLHTQTIREKD